jgi:hypothetical protein
MLGYCGVNCAECPAYQGTVGSKIELLEKAAQAFSKGADSPKEWVCLGCTPADQAFLAKPCAACKMRTCAIAKGVQNCAACADYESCQKIQPILEPWGLAQRMTWLRERFKAMAAGNG